MLTTEPTSEMVSEWKRIYDAYRADLRPNRKSGSEVNEYFRAKYSYRVFDDARFKKVVELNITENSYSRNKLPIGASPDVQCYRVNDVLVGIDLSSGEFHVECEDISKAVTIYDDLFAFRGLDEDDLENFFLVAEYVKLTCKCDKQRIYFLKTEHIGFSKWNSADTGLAEALWGDPAVTRYICADGRFSCDDIKNRLATEIANGVKYNVEYWPIFELSSGDFIGCCELRPHGESEYEIGFHLRPGFWGQGYAREAAQAVIQYAFYNLDAMSLFAGHNPNNIASGKLLTKLGFAYIGDEFYTPTGLYHPSYRLKKKSD